MEGNSGENAKKNAKSKFVPVFNLYHLRLSQLYRFKEKVRCGFRTRMDGWIENKYFHL